MSVPGCKVAKQYCVGDVIEWETANEKTTGTIIAIKDYSYVIEYSPWGDTMTVPIMDTSAIRLTKSAKR